MFCARPSVSDAIALILCNVDRDCKHLLQKEENDGRIAQAMAKTFVSAKMHPSRIYSQAHLKNLKGTGPVVISVRSVSAFE